MELPAGLTAAPYTADDLDAVFAVAAAQQQHDIGRVDVETADFEADWQRSSFDFATMTMGVYDGDTPRRVRRADRRRPRRGRRAAGVPPPGHRHRPRPLARGGRARGTATPRSAGPVPQGSDGDRLLEKLGYDVRWTSWVLQLPEGATVPERALPPGYAIRAATPDDYEAVWNVVEDAFLEWSVREREPFEDFLAVTVRRPGHEPWMLRVVTDPAGEVVGTAMLVMAGDPVDRGVHRAARGPQGPAGPGPGPGAARRRLRAGPRARRAPVRALDRLAHRRAQPLREGRHGGHRRVGEPRRSTSSQVSEMSGVRLGQRVELGLDTLVALVGPVVVGLGLVDTFVDAHRPEDQREHDGDDEVGDEASRAM